MVNFYRHFLVFVFVFSFYANTYAQNDSLSPVKVAVFVPLYADEVFDNLSVSDTKASLPKSVLPGLEFYNGVMMAIDSLNKEGAKVEISIYDTKQTTQTLSALLKSPSLNKVGLIIAAITNTAELKIFADQALAKNIPLISATYPNYVGVASNPFFVLLNSSFQAHLEGLYKYMQRFYNAHTITAITKKGTTEDYIKSYITSLTKSAGGIPLKIKWITVDEYKLSNADFRTSLDSTKANIFFVASPQESFGLKVVKTLNNNENYSITAIGMPTWDGIKELDRSNCRNVEIVFSTPFLYYSQNVGLSSLINRTYKDRFYSRPSDMVYKGYEITYHFTKLLSKYRHNLVNNLNDTNFTLFNQFNLQPVKLRSANIKPDYLENKKLYFIKKQQGNVKSVI